LSVGAESTDGESVTEELNRVLSGEALAKSPQLQAMLAYVVKETLAGRGSQIKALNIAVDVFGRDESFDPATDSIVRVQAGRLRDALGRHYETTAGASDIRIELPKGTYEPVFVRSETGGVPARAEPSAPGGVDKAPVANDASRAQDAKVSAPSMDGSVADEGTGSRRSRRRFLSLCSAAILAVAVATLGYVFFAGSFGGREEAAREGGRLRRRQSTPCCSPR
jgi:hypothetical protein